jgi:iron complex outermembrane receptor protein
MLTKIIALGFFLVALWAPAAAQSDSALDTVSATRTSHPVEDEPAPVEILRNEGAASDLGGLLEDAIGVRVELTSPAFATTSARLRGLAGEYTAVLFDGLPLLGVPFRGLSLSQVPSLDVQHAEVIQGASTALYGPAALGGVVYVVSRPPGNERELLVGQTSQAGSEAQGWFSQRLNPRFGVTLLGSVERQGAYDVDHDGWADLAGVRRVELRPRVFWNNGHGGSVLATLGGMSEIREGGTLPGATAPNGQPFGTASNTNHADGGVVGTFPVAHASLLTIRASATSQWEREDFGQLASLNSQHGRHTTAFSEVTLAVPRARGMLLVGAAFEHDAYQSPDVSGFDYTYDTPSLFALATLPLGSHVSITASGRCGRHSQFGTFCSPWVSSLVRAPGSWAVRLSGASGFSAPTPFVDETQGVPFARLVPFTTQTIFVCSPGLCLNDSGAVGSTAPFSLQAERALYGSLDLMRRMGPLALRATVFAFTIDHPLMLSELNPFDERPQLVNAPGPDRSTGAELFGTYDRAPWKVALKYTWLQATAISPATGNRTDAALTPKNSGALEVAWGFGPARTGVAWYAEYTGRQAVYDDPYRQTTPAYTTFGLLVSHRFGGATFYLNGENLGDVRQTHYDPLVTPAPSEDLQWTTEVWAPLEGRVINAGLRLAF